MVSGFMMWYACSHIKGTFHTTTHTCIYIPSKSLTYFFLGYQLLSLWKCIYLVFEKKPGNWFYDIWTESWFHSLFPSAGYYRFTMPALDQQEKARMRYLSNVLLIESRIDTRLEIRDVLPIISSSCWHAVNIGEMLKPTLAASERSLWLTWCKKCNFGYIGKRWGLDCLKYAMASVA